MRWMVVMVGLLLPSVSEAAITFSEIAWMGTTNSANDEWIELYNDGVTADVTGWTISDGMNLEIELIGSISGSEYAVLERTDDDSAPGTAFLVYTGSLTNNGATLVLRDAVGSIQDQVAGGENWENIGGDNVTKETAQYSSGGWVTAAATPGVANATESSVTEVVEAEEKDGSPVVTKSSNSSASKSAKLELKNEVLTLKLTAPERAYVNQVVTFEVEPSGIAKRLMPSITYDWNFGDLQTGSGTDVQHTYAYPGTYVVYVDAGYARHEATIRHEITVLPVNFSITRTRQGDIQINNDAKYEIDLSGYQIQAREMVKIPENTVLLPGATITIPHEMVSAAANDLVVLSDTENAILATHGMSSNQMQTIAAPVESLVAYSAPPVRVPQIAPASFNFAAADIESEPEIVEEASVSTTTISPQAAQLQQSAAASLPTDSMAYFGLAGILALGFLGVFAGRIRNE